MLTSRHVRSVGPLIVCLALAFAPLLHGQSGVPSAPTNLQAAVAGNLLSLSWAPGSSGGAPTGYTLVARTSVGGPVLATVPVGNVPSFSANGPNGVYVLSVAASNASGTGPESSSVTVTLPTAPAAPGAPSGLAVAVAGDTATFTWNAPSSGGPVANYVLFAGLTPGFAAPLASLPLSAASTSFAIPGVPPGTYYIRIVAQNAGGTSAPTNEVTLTVAGPAAPGAPTLAYSGTGNTLNLSWAPGGGGAPTSYVLSALTTGGALLASVPLSGTDVTFPGVPSGTYVLRLVAVNAVGASPASDDVTVTLPITAPPTSGPIVQIGSDITSADANFGNGVALSANGQRLVVGAYSSANGTTRVYQRSGSTWTQIGADIVGEAAGDRAGYAVAINASGSRIAVGAYLNGASNAGHVRVYDLVGSTWTQVGQDLDGTSNGAQFGFSVGLSADGSRLVASATFANSTTTSGQAKVYDLVAGTWTQVGSTLGGPNGFGQDVAMSSDGTTIAVPSPSAAGSSRAGTVQVFRLIGGNWTQVGNVIQGEAIADGFGRAVSLSANGSRLVASAPSDAEGGRAGGGAQAGKVRVFDLVGGTWTQVGNDVLGTPGQVLGTFGVALSDDGSRFIVEAASFSLAKVYRLVGGAWTQVGSDVKTANGIRTQGVAMSADGNTIALGFVYGSPRRVSVFSVTP